MKKATKILSMILCVVLTVCAAVAALAFGSLAADDEVTYERSGVETGYDYVDKSNYGKKGIIVMSNTDDLQVAFENALEKTTIYMNSDMTHRFKTDKEYIHIGYRYKNNGASQGDVNVYNYGGPFVFDMGGNTLTFIQKGYQNTVNVASLNTLTFKDGTIKVGLAGQEGDAASAYPLIDQRWGYSKVVFDNVNTMSAGLVTVSNDRGNEDNTLTVMGGIHYVIATPAAGIDKTDNEPYAIGAFIDARANITASVKNATIYIKEGNHLINMASYARTDTTEAKGMFVFNDCTIIGENAGTSLIKNLNEKAEVEFTKSYVYGSINPSQMERDKASYGAATSENVYFNHGVKYSSEAVLNVVFNKDATNFNEQNTVESFKLPVIYGEGEVDVQGLNGIYQITDTNANVVFDRYSYVKDILAILDANDNVIKTFPYETKIGDAIAEVDVGQTLKFLMDIHSVGEADENGNGKTYIAVIDKGITIDLNGYSWTLEQITAPNGSVEQRVSVKAPISQQVVIKNGTLGAKCTDKVNTAFTFFHVESNAVDITFDNVNTYLATLVLVYRGNGTKITINGGEHYTVFDSTGGPSGYVATYDNIDFVANDALFYVGSDFGNSGPRLFASSNHTTGASVYKEISFIYNNCDIISAKYDNTLNDCSADEIVGDDMLKTISSTTDVFFNGCRIYGTMASDEVYPPSKDERVDAGSIRYGHGTKFYSIQLRTDGVVVPARFDAQTAFLPIETESITYTIKRPFSSDVLGTNWKTRTVTLELVYDRVVETDRAFEIFDKDGVTSLGYLRDVYENGRLVNKITFYEAVQEVYQKFGSGYTLRLLSDYVYDPENLEEGSFTSKDASYYASFSKGITIDLGGFEMRIFKGSSTFASKWGGKWVDSKDNPTAGQEKFNITAAGETVKFKNGTIKVTDLIKTDRTFPIFSVSKDNSIIELENVNTYSGGLVYSYSNTSKITINGGTHVAYRTPQGVNGDSAYIICRNSLDLTVNDAVFISTTENGTAKNNCAFVGVNSRNDSVASTATYTLTFNNCVITMSNVKNNIISNMNEKTTVYFNGCSLYGSLNPVEMGVDKAPKARSIIMGMDNNRPEGSYGTATGKATVWNAGGNINASLVFGARTYGIINTSVSQSYNAAVYTYNYTPQSYGWLLSDKSYETTYNKSIAPGHEVNFYLYDRTEPIDTIWIAPGYEAFLPEVTLTNVNNGWYKLVYSAGKWSTTPLTTQTLENSGYDFANTESSLVINEPTSFYPVCTFKPYLSLAKYNLALRSHFAIKVYIPKNTPEGVTLNKIAGKDLSGLLTMGGIQYYSYGVSTPNVTQITTQYSTTVDFTVNNLVDGNGNPLKVTQTIKKMSISNYIKTVLASSEKEIADAQTVMADLLRYSNCVYQYFGMTVPKEQADLYQQCISLGLCTPIDEAKYDAALKDTTADYSGISQFIQSVTFNVAADKPRIMFMFREGMVTNYKDVTFTIKDGWLINNTVYKEEGKVNWGSSVYTPNANYDVIYYTNIEGVYVRGSAGKYVKADATGKDLGISFKEDENQYVTSVYALRVDNMPIYNVDKVLTVSIKSNGVNYEGTYDIDSYYQYHQNRYEQGMLSEAEAQTYLKVRELLFAIRAYSSSAAAYRFGPAKSENGYVYWY